MIDVILESGCLPDFSPAPNTSKCFYISPANYYVTHYTAEYLCRNKTNNTGRLVDIRDKAIHDYLKRQIPAHNYPTLDQCTSFLIIYSVEYFFLGKSTYF